MSLVVVGSVALDSIQTPVVQADDILGGSAAYFSIAASYFHPVQLVAVVGEDFPDEHLHFLTERAIDLDGLQRVAGLTFRWRGRYSDDFEVAHTLETQLNVFENFQPVLPRSARDAEFVFLANIDPALQLRVLDQIRAPRFTACDTMNFWIEGKRDELLETIRRIDMLFLNEEEARQLTGMKALPAAADALLEFGLMGVVIKLGAKGVMCYTRDDFFRLPAYPVSTLVDTTGAGDSFAGGYMGSLAHQGTVNSESLRRALVCGTVTSSFNVESLSMKRLSEISLDDIRIRYQELQAMTRFGDFFA